MWRVDFTTRLAGADSAPAQRDTHEQLAFDQTGQDILEGQLVVVGLLELPGEGRGHGGELERSALFQGGML